MSPWSAGRAVANSDQLNPYLTAYGTPVPQSTPEGGPGEAGPGAEFGPAAAAAGGGGVYGGAEDQGPSPSPALPIGRDAPAYRPSLVGWVR